MKKWLVSFLAFLLLLSVIGCSSATPAPTSSDSTSQPNQPAANQPTPSKQKNELRVALSVAPPTLDLHKTTAIATQQVSWHIYEYLVTLDKEYKVVPMLAEKIELSEDGKTITLPLRKDIKFHNGKTMTAEDALASLNRWKELSSIGRAALANATISAKDGQTIQISLPQPSSAVLPALAYPQQGAVIMPKETIEAAGEEGVKEYIGTGPFQFVEWKQDQYIHLKKFADYKPLSEPTSGLAGKREAKVDDLYFIPVPDAATRVAGVQSGEFDFADEIPFDNYNLIKDDPNLVATITKPRRYNGLVFNSKNGLFANVKMRQAVNAALDMESIMLAATGDSQFFRLDHGLMYQEQAWYVDSGKEHYNQKNPEKAKQLLSEAGYKGEPITILGTRDYEFLYKSALLVKDQLEKVGMTVNLEIYDWPTLVSKRSDEKAWNIFFTFFPIYTNPTQTLFLDSRNKWPGWYSNPKMDQLLDQMRSTTNFDEEKKIFEQVQALFWEDVPVIKLGDMHGLTAQAKHVRDFNFFMDLSFWNVSVQ
jgi:peptide/nickel transport system substrate-binding protein